ncbi:YgfZ/GcvT domain-containing protein [Microcella indica]|uniref:CAF17-like 4Fe-4S cluster assembly/insertion protein YgfZ n=1 Tax=Microcella indica TaxID=2750620 RepID=UPI0015CF13A4|nr:folate-binding protein YgfZ [Microcella indica]
MTSPFLALPGSVADSSGRVAAHYGEPVAEQRMLAAGRAIVDLSDRGVVTVTGEDRLRWLDSLTSQSIAHLAPGSSAETLLLDPQGRLEHSMRLVDDGTTTWLLVDGEQAAPLAAWLDRMRFMMQVEVADASAEWATLGQLSAADGDGAGGSLLVSAAAPHDVPVVWRDPWTAVQEGGWQYAASAEHPGGAFPAAEILVARDEFTALADRARAGELAVAGTLALEALRIAAWRPRQATEADERTIPHELDWMRSAVHLAKGCYRGQETVAKVHNLGHPPRRLVLLHLDGSAGVLPGAGSVVLDGEKEVGTVTSSARHHELGPIGLAVVKRTLDPQAPLTVRIDDEGESPAELVAAAQEVIVPVEAGATAGVPRMPRLGAVQR